MKFSEFIGQFRYKDRYDFIIKERGGTYNSRETTYKIYDKYGQRDNDLPTDIDYYVAHVAKNACNYDENSYLKLVHDYCYGKQFELERLEKNTYADEYFRFGR